MAARDCVCGCSWGLAPTPPPTRSRPCFHSLRQCGIYTLLMPLPVIPLSSSLAYQPSPRCVVLCLLDVSHVLGALPTAPSPALAAPLRGPPCQGTGGGGTRWVAHPAACWGGPRWEGPLRASGSPMGASSRGGPRRPSPSATSGRLGISLPSCPPPGLLPAAPFLLPPVSSSRPGEPCLAPFAAPRLRSFRRAPGSTVSAPTPYHALRCARHGPQSLSESRGAISVAPRSRPPPPPPPPCRPPS